jgi:two-component system response regulator FixJ
MIPVTTFDPLVFIVDDEPSVREMLVSMLRAARHKTVAYGSAEEFLGAWRPEQHGVVLLDICMPGMSGVDVQKQLRDRRSELRFLFLSGADDVGTAIQVMRDGAFDYIEKPFETAVLLERVDAAIQDLRHSFEAAARLGLLTERQKQVLALVVEGLPNKAIAARLGLSEKTVESHRHQVMHRLAVGNVPDLVKLVLSLEPRGTQPC